MKEDTLKSTLIEGEENLETEEIPSNDNTHISTKYFT